MLKSLLKHQITNNKFKPPQQIEEVPMKWMDRPSATEMDRGSAYEMDTQTKCHKNAKAIEMDKI